MAMMASNQKIVTAYEATPRPRFTVPRVVFITERRHGWTLKQYAYPSTGRNRTTGKLTLAIAVKKRRNGIVHFDGDLFRLDLDLHPDAISRLYRHWHDLNSDYSLPRRIAARMDGPHFGKTTIIFDATAEQTDDWKDFLTAVLSDRASYIEIKCGSAALARCGRSASEW